MSIRGPNRTVFPSDFENPPSNQTALQSGAIGQGVQPAQNAQAARSTTAGPVTTSVDRNSVHIIGQQSKSQSVVPTASGDGRAKGSASERPALFDERQVSKILEELVNYENQGSALRHRLGSLIRDVQDLVENSTCLDSMRVYLILTLHRFRRAGRNAGACCEGSAEIWRSTSV
jgi:hypothetical protein